MVLIHVSEEIKDRVPETLKNLEDKKYTIVKLSYKEDRENSSLIPTGRYYYGNVCVVNRGGGPSLVVGNYPLGSSLITSWIISAEEIDTKEHHGIKVETENSFYLIEEFIEHKNYN